MKTTEMLEDMVETAKKAEVDLRKFDNGNTTAGIRARKVMQKVRRKAKGIRQEIQRLRKERRAANAEVDQN